jgi:hypothetical protein
MASRKLCPEMCPDAVRSRSKLTKRQPISYARTGLKSFDLRPDSQSLVTLANRRLQPLGHLTADSQVYVTQTVTRKRSRVKPRSWFAFKNAAFDAKCLHENEFVPFMAACTRETGLGTVLGTHAPFFRAACQKMEVKCRKAAA